MAIRDPSNLPRLGFPALPARTTSTETTRRTGASVAISGTEQPVRSPLPTTLPRLRCRLRHLLRGVSGPPYSRVTAPVRCWSIARCWWPCGAPEPIPASYARPSSGSSTVGGPTWPGRWRGSSPIRGRRPRRRRRGRTRAAAPGPHSTAWLDTCHPPRSRAGYAGRSPVRGQGAGPRPRYTATSGAVGPRTLGERAGAFGPGPDSTALQGQTVLLVDDVKTTGATLCASATACRAAGARRVVGLVVGHERA